MVLSIRETNYTFNYANAPGPAESASRPEAVSISLIVCFLLEVRSSSLSLEINTVKCISKALKKIIGYSLAGRIVNQFLKPCNGLNVAYKKYKIQALHYITLSVQ